MSARTNDTSDGAATGSILTDLRASGDASAGAPEAGPVRPRRRINPQTLVLALVLTASAGALYMMRRQGMRGGLTFTKTVGEHDLEKVQKKVTADEKRILEDLARSTAIAEAPPEKIAKNPFVLGSEEAKPAPGLDPEAEARARAERERSDRAKHEEEIRTRLTNVVLTSVMEGPTPVAYVSGKLVKVGDVLEEVFTVAQIHDRSIELLADGKTFMVQMSETAGGGGRRPNRSLGSPFPGGPPR